MKKAFKVIISVLCACAAGFIAYESFTLHHIKNIIHNTLDPDK